MIRIKDTREVGHEIKVVSNLMRRKLQQVPEFDTWTNMTDNQGWIIKYLYDHRDEDVFQRDLETAFSVRRSTVTGMIQLMEKKGLVVREAVESDARLKKIVLTEKAIDLQHNVEETIKRFEAALTQGISQEERDQFFQIMSKIKENLK